jgi:hypothetical protein
VYRFGIDIDIFTHF